MNREALQNFAREFADFTEDYAIIGGAACHLWFASRNTDFRITQDMDLVLLVRTESQPFLQKLLDFLKQHDLSGGNYCVRRWHAQDAPLPLQQ